MSNELATGLALTVLATIIVGFLVLLIRATMGFEEAAESFRTLFSKNPQEHRRKREHERQRSAPGAVQTPEHP